MGTFEYSTWCYLTFFVCRWDQLDEAKKRYQIRVDALRGTEHEVLFATEQAYINGNSDLLFDLLIEEIVGRDVHLSDEEKDEYSMFIFPTVIRVAELHDDIIRELAADLEIDYQNDFPARFPSRTRSVLMTESGHEYKGCIAQ